MSSKIDLEKIPELGGWVSIQRAADAMKLSRQAVSKMVHSGALQYDDMRRVAYGKKAENDLLLVRVGWVRDQVAKRIEQAEARRAKLDAAADAMPSIDPVDEETEMKLAG